MAAFADLGAGSDHLRSNRDERAHPRLMRIAAADEAMYRAKANGTDKTTIIKV